MPPKKKVKKPLTAIESLRNSNAVRPELFNYSDMFLREDRRLSLKKNKEKVDKLVDRAIPYLSK